MDARGLQKEVISEKDAADRKFAGVVAKAEAEAKHHRASSELVRLIWKLRWKHHRVKLMSHVVVGRPAPAIVAFIAWDGFDLLVTGFKGHSALYHRILGKTTDRLVELVPCAVLVVK